MKVSAWSLLSVLQSNFNTKLGLYQVMRLISLAVKKNPDVVFYTSYHERSISRSLVPYLDMFSLTAENISLSSFLHPAHREGVCEFKMDTVPCSLGHASRRNSAARVREVMSFDSIYLIRVCNKR